MSEINEQREQRNFDKATSYTGIWDRGEVMKDWEKQTDKIAEELFCQRALGKGSTDFDWRGFKKKFPESAKQFIILAKPLAQAAHEAGEAKGIKTVLDLVKEHWDMSGEKWWQSFLKRHGMEGKHGDFNR